LRIPAVGTRGPCRKQALRRSARNYFAGLCGGYPNWLGLFYAVFDLDRAFKERCVLSSSSPGARGFSVRWI